MLNAAVFLSQRVFAPCVVTFGDNVAGNREGPGSIPHAIFAVAPTPF